MTLPSDAPGMFGYLVTRLAAHPENVATDALHYVLSTSPIVGRALEDHLRRVVDLPVGLHYDVQAAADDGSIPDLAGVAEDGSTPLLLEAKFYAGLTANQPVGYLRRLPAARPALLLFVVPAARLELLWTEVTARAGLTDPTAPAGDFRQVAVNDRHTLAMTSWRALLAVLAEAAVASGDQAAAANLAQLRGLCERMDDQAFHPIAPEELSGSVAVRLQQYLGLINKAVDRLIDAEVATTGSNDFRRGGLRAGVQWWGRYFGVSGTSCLLRISAGPWARDRATPLWLQIGYNSSPPPAAIHAALKPLQAERNRVFRRHTCVDVAIDLLPGAEEDAVLDHITRQIERVAACLPGLGTPGVDAAPAAEDDDLPGDDLTPDDGAGTPA
ncbi:hypothetical protein [Geodermatophilus sabuli]|uniref:PD-(D/E)XK nuclease superfamily protein n=1 Tax=Geodermatophilus sabuli TaxID=1564158 RepID=A0A285EER0_9ACTN|nr:hypothetical protein [Geodermatophilus sabuli]MBB3084197.1 hypothetical protein [Geodermatophilus sabuli]SNX96531.1 hypothetical protein SAMN06893097_104246 [Geodermatophilus sabuli]